MSNINGINSVVSSILNMTNEEKSEMFMNLFVKGNDAINHVAETVKETVMTEENITIVQVVKKHAVAACVNSYAAAKEGAVITAVSSAAASVYSTKKVAEGTKKLADVTAKKSKSFAAWILAQ